MLATIAGAESLYELLQYGVLAQDDLLIIRFAPFNETTVKTWPWLIAWCLILGALFIVPGGIAVANGKTGAVAAIVFGALCLMLAVGSWSMFGVGRAQVADRATDGIASRDTLYIYNKETGELRRQKGSEDEQLSGEGVTYSKRNTATHRGPKYLYTLHWDDGEAVVLAADTEAQQSTVEGIFKKFGIKEQ
ncbi:hypothetical protein HYS28_01855 [Candidatus Uhrbacteria bacterium]|nr:hypothetical protein [Candidatus Uhrbacteria bacterium]